MDISNLVIGGFLTIIGCYLLGAIYVVFSHVTGWSINIPQTNLGRNKILFMGAAFLLCILFFTLPLVQCTQDSSMTATGWEIATDKSEMRSEAAPLVFLLLIVPIVLLILTFTSISFVMLRNVSLIGLLTKIIFIIVVYTQYGDYFVPTIFCWLVLAIYIGLCGFAQYYKKLE
jgi:hypothetical protein